MTRSKPEPKTAHRADIQAARDVIEREIEGLQALYETIDQKFLKAVDILLATKGRVIVSGMGKSGHIARKIAATFASTGTPAMFIHPGEASHGDLGMVTKEDSLLLLSNSGETSELQDMIAYARRFSIPLIGMVRRATSVLVEASDVALVLPAIPEATITGAPTTSTTMMLALGDALAVTLLKRRGFTRDDFHVFHPGGKLGAAFTRVKDLMHKDDQLPVVPYATPMSEAILVMTAKSFGSVGITDEQGHLAGIVTDGDLRRHMGEDLLNHPAGDIMTRDPVTARPSMLAAEALGIMNRRSITALYVVEDGKPVGILHIHDCLRAGIA